MPAASPEVQVPVAGISRLVIASTTIGGTGETWGSHAHGWSRSLFLVSLTLPSETRSYSTLSTAVVVVPGVITIAQLDCIALVRLSSLLYPSPRRTPGYPLQRMSPTSSYGRSNARFKDLVASRIYDPEVNCFKGGPSIAKSPST